MAQARVFVPPPSRSNGKVLAPPVSPLGLYLSILQSGASNLVDLYNAVGKIKNFDWRSASDISKYINPNTRDRSIVPNDLYSVTGASKSWANAGKYINPPVDQGQCGNCYACCTVGMLSDRYAILHDLDSSQGQYLFSVGQATAGSSVGVSAVSAVSGVQGNGAAQAAVSCSASTNQGCNGGLPCAVGKYVQNQGIYFKDACGYPPGVLFQADECTAGTGCCAVPSAVAPACNGGNQPTPNQPTPNQHPDFKQRNFPILCDYTVPLSNPSNQLNVSASQSTVNAITNYVQYYSGPPNFTLQSPTSNATYEERKGIQNYMKYQLLAYGPFSAVFYVDETPGGGDSFSQYPNQPMTAATVWPKASDGNPIFVGKSVGSPNHGIEIIGFGTSEGGATDEKGQPLEYWIVKNSWGKGWGIDGYFYFAMSTATINAGYFMDYPMVDGTTYFGGGTGALLKGMDPINVEGKVGGSGVSAAALFSPGGPVSPTPNSQPVPNQPNQQPVPNQQPTPNSQPNQPAQSNPYLTPTVRELPQDLIVGSSRVTKDHLRLILGRAVRGVQAVKTRQTEAAQSSGSNVALIIAVVIALVILLFLFLRAVF